MPVEVGATGSASATTVGAAYLAEACTTLSQSLTKIEHCLAQLPEADLWWRPHPSHNSLQNIILHLCGNLRQWIIHGVRGEPDDRNRPGEFADREPRPAAELLDRLRATIAESVTVLRNFPDSRLLEPRRIQGFETTVLAAILETVSHFVGHTHQIVYITRLRLGEGYRFQWTPAPGQTGG